MNSTAQKNELIFSYSSGILGDAKSLLVSMYLHLNSNASKNASIFDNMLGNQLFDTEDKAPKNLKFTDCIGENTISKKIPKNTNTPLSEIIGDIKDIKWKSVFKGFSEYVLPIKDNDKIKLIKMDAGTAVPLHSHNGKEYILVIDGSFCDEYGEYSKGDLQINDHNIRHHPTACKKEGCVCLSITENDVVFYGPFAPILNLFTFVKSFLK